MKGGKQLDIWSDSPQQIVDRVNELFDKGSIKNDPELEHVWYHRIVIPWLTDSLTEIEFRKRLNSHGVGNMINEHCTDLFVGAPVKIKAELCDGCGSTITSDVCSCGLVNNNFDISEMAEVEFKSHYKPAQRFKKAFVRILRQVGYWALEDEFKAILEAYNLIIHTQTQSGDRNLLNLWFVLYKLVELFISDEFNRGLILKKIRLPRDSKRLIAWDLRWRNITQNLECLEYRPTLKARGGFVGVKKYDTDGLDI